MQLTRVYKFTMAMRDQFDSARSLAQHLIYEATVAQPRGNPKRVRTIGAQEFKNSAPQAMLLQELDSNERRKKRCGLEEYPIVTVATIDSLSLIKDAQRRN